MTIREGRLLVQGRLKVRTWEKRERLRESGSINRVERVARVEGLMKKIERSVAGLRRGVASGLIVRGDWHHGRRKLLW